IRIEWSNLETSQQIAYLDAERCLWDLPAETHLPNVTSRYTDLVALHQSLTDYVHWDGVFLPWHRYLLHTHETLLRTQCNYTGPIPWWDERKDAGAFQNASIFSASTFGTISGTPYSGMIADQDESDYICVTDGYFANSTLHIGFGSEETYHCLSRDVNEEQSAYTSEAWVDQCNAYGNYTEMFNCVFQYPHGGGHSGVGGVMGDVSGSPGDPVFFLHHGFVDRNWWAWQSADPDNRLYQLSGYTTESEPATGWVNVTLEYNLTSYEILPDVTIERVMDTEGGYLCYTYD
ncbi:Di-copper centre-containing protein, partial [Aspergillus japonicus CBS 114.51]